ncbi:hypothetical protein [Rhizorhabdus sp. FW153]|uniref:hypothetical protein n=1 Tax=Rhizorhabdus sp. FW153 TaxID=3400216 RepID=UPI003CE722E8
MARAVEPFIPVVGPLREMERDYRKGDYRGAAFNAAMLALEMTPMGPMARVARQVQAINKFRRGEFLARAATQQQRIRKVEGLARPRGARAANLQPPLREVRSRLAPDGSTRYHPDGRYEVHHTIGFTQLGPIQAAQRNAEGLWRNHPINLKVVPMEIHDRLHGRGPLPAYGVAGKLWHGTNDVQKTVALATGAVAADAVDGVKRLKSEQPRRQEAR